MPGLLTHGNNEVINAGMYVVLSCKVFVNKLCSTENQSTAMTIIAKRQCLNIIQVDGKR